MLVKFFSKPSRGGGGGKSSIDYLLDEEKHKGEEGIEVLQGDPKLSAAIAESLEFATNYTVGCLSFEEDVDALTDEQKYEIIERFEKAIFSGLDKEQYNILWVQHSDKDRLELNFFIPNVELTSGKRLQPYYDKADRPIVENFKQIINHEYSLTDPNAPEKQQTLIIQKNLPKPKKKALEAINNGIGGLVLSGKINSREDVLAALEETGFEIARVTPKNISIKTEGQNLRLKGAFYEETFRDGKSIRGTIEDRSEQYNRDSEKRYQTARGRLDSAVTRRTEEFTKRYPNRGEEISQEIADNVQHYESIVNRIDRLDSGGLDALGNVGIQQNDRVETISQELPKDKQINQGESLHNQAGGEEPILRRNRPYAQGAILGRERNNGNTTHRSGGLSNDEHRKATGERIEEFIGKGRGKHDEISGRIKEFTGRKRINNADVQRDNHTKQTNQRTINELDGINKTIETIVKKHKHTLNIK